LYFYYSENLNWATCAPRVGHSWFKSKYPSGKHNVW